MTIRLNGEEKTLPEGTTLRGLVSALGLSDKGLGLEHNGVMVLRGQWEGTVLCDGDVVEAVHFVGGG